MRTAFTRPGRPAILFTVLLLISVLAGTITVRSQSYPPQAIGSLVGTTEGITATGRIPLHVLITGTDGTAQSIGGGVQYAEDTVHASGNTGNLVLAVRNDAGTALAADGDNSVLQVDSTGALRVAGGGGGTQYTEGDAADTTMTGTVALMEIAGNLVAPLQGTVADGLLVNLGTNNDVVVSATNLDVQIGGSDSLTIGTMPADATELTTADLDTGAGTVTRAEIGLIFASSGGPTQVSASAGLPVNIVAGSSSGALADDADFTAGTTNFTPTGGFYQSTVTACTDGDTCAFGITAQRTLKATLYTAAGVEVAAATTTEATHDAALTPGSTVGGVPMLLAKDFDGAALPNAVSLEGDAVIPAATLSGVQYMMLVSEDGSLQYGTSTTPLVVGDGSGALNVIADSGTITTVTTLTGTTTLTPGTGATNLGKAIDSVAGATDTGVAILAIRDDTLSALTPVEGDWVGLRVNSTGALHVTGGGGGTQYNIDDVASATATGTVALVVRKDSAASLAGTDGDITGLQVDANGALRVTGGGGGTEYTVNGVAPADPTGATFVMERDDALSALTEVEGDWTNPRSNANGALWTAVDGTVTVSDGAGALNTIIDSGTVTTVSTVTTLSQFGGNAINLGAGAFGTGTLRVIIANDDDVSDAATLFEANLVAADAADAGSPLKIGGYASTTPPTAVSAAGDRVNAWYTLNGAAVTVPGGASVHYRTAAGTTEDEHEIKATAGTLYSVLITNTNAAVRYIRCYNLTAANTTPGTSTVFWGAAVPGATTGAGFVYSFPSGLTFDTALTCAWTTGAADTDVAEVAANEIKATYTYR